MSLRATGAASEWLAARDKGTTAAGVRDEACGLG